MRGVFVVVLSAAIVVQLSHLQASRGPLAGEPAVTIQIHDYEHLPEAQLARAREIVTRIYGKSNVQIEWRGVLRPDTRPKRGSAEARASEGPAAQVTLIILTAAMAARGRIPPGVLGYAAVPPDGGMGRIAYVVYDRIREIARPRPSREVDLLGFVMAHETGHLLLGRGSGTGTGLMKCHWDRRGAELLDPMQLGFSELQTARIQDRLAHTAPPALAATGTAPADNTTATVDR